MIQAAVLSTLPWLALAAVVLLLAWAVAAKPWWAQRRHARIRAEPFPARWQQILAQRVPLAARLGDTLQQRLHGHIQVFIAEKPFIGCQGQAIDDEVRVTIAAQACMLLLGHTAPECFPRLRQILVYPDAFVVDREMPLGAGLVHAHRQLLAGESWGQGQLILAWSEVLAGAADAADARNVVLHEFAHQIDQDKGVADGRPWRPSAAKRRRWAAVMDEALEQLRSQPSGVIDAYGASNPAEYFAVVTEAFFERPQALAAEAPAVYCELAELYHLDPAEWQIEITSQTNLQSKI